MNSLKNGNQSYILVYTDEKMILFQVNEKIIQTIELQKCDPFLKLRNELGKVKKKCYFDLVACLKTSDAVPFAEFLCGKSRIHKIFLTKRRT